MHIDLGRWVQTLNNKLDAIEAMLPSLNDDANLFSVELAAVTAAYVARKIGDNANIYVAVSDDDGDRMDELPATTLLTDTKLPLHFAYGRGKDSGVWANVDVSEAFELGPVEKQSETRDLEFVFNRMVHSIRFDTGPVGKLGTCLLFASDHDLEKKARIWVMPVEQFIGEARKFAGRQFEYRMPTRRPS